MAKSVTLASADSPPKRRSPRKLSIDEIPPDDERAIFGKNFMVARLKRAMTLTEVGRVAGVSAQYVSRVEHGRANLTLTTMKKLATAVGYDIQLVEGEADPPARSSRKNGAT